MILNRIRPTVLASCALALLCTVPAHSESWAGQSFLSDYSKLQPVKGKEGKDFMYVAPGVEQRAKIYTSVMLDEPEVFISPESPYKGAKPEDIAAISGLLRSTTSASLQERGYKIVDKPGADVLYVRLAVTDLQIAKKKRNQLAYTPVGFVVDAGVKALQDFMAKYDVLDLALQGEIQDSYLRKTLEISALKQQSIYAGLGLQVAGLYDRIDLVDDGEVYGASAYLAGPTPIGMFTVGTGVSSDAWSVWLSLGRPIGKGSILDEGLFR